MVSANSVTLLPGYSDAINHAFAFAAKHHDRQVRKGTKLPYLTHPANIAVILTRYGRDEDSVVAGILHDVVEDCVRDGYTQEMLEQRMGEKFGDAVLQTVLQVTYRRLDDDGVELSSSERKEDYLERLSEANESARWVCAADKLHNARSILADLERTFAFLFEQLNVNGTEDHIHRFVQAPLQHHTALKPALVAAEDDADAGE